MWLTNTGLDLQIWLSASPAPWHSQRWSADLMATRTRPRLVFIVVLIINTTASLFVMSLLGAAWLFWEGRLRDNFWPRRQNKESVETLAERENRSPMFIMQPGYVQVGWIETFKLPVTRSWAKLLSYTPLLG